MAPPQPPPTLSPVKVTLVSSAKRSLNKRSVTISQIDVSLSFLNGCLSAGWLEVGAHNSTITGVITPVTHLLEGHLYGLEFL